MNALVTDRPPCPHPSCVQDQQIGSTNVVIHDRRRNRFLCKQCGKTWVGHRSELRFGLRSPVVKIGRVLELLGVGFSIRRVAGLVKVSPSTVQRWKGRKNS